MNSKKGLLATTTAITLLSMTLAACSSSNNGSSSSIGNQANSGTSNSDEKPVELSMAIVTTGNITDQPLVEEAISKITKEKINATVKLLPFGFSNYAQQTSLMLAGNDKLDLMLSSSFFGYNAQAAKGQLVPLDELLAQYGQGIKEVVGEKILDATRVGGQIYGVPSIRDLGADYGLLMRKDLVDKYKIDLTQVKSYTDLEPIFKTIKDNEPGITPLVNAGDNNTPVNIMVSDKFDTLSDSFGVIRADSTDMKVVNLFEQPEYKDAIHLVRKWYEAGYISKDVATTQQTGGDIVKSGKAFGYLTNMKPGFEVQESASLGKEMVAVRLTKPFTQTTNITSFMLSIAKNSKNPEKAMQLMNLMYTDKDIVNLLDNGIEGKHYVVKSDGTIGKPEGVSDVGWVFNQWAMGNNYLSYVTEGNDPKMWEKLKAFNEGTTKSPALGFSFDPQNVKTEFTAVTNVNNQFRKGLETGMVSPEQLDNFNQKLKAAGLDKIIAEKQKQMDAWAAANK